MSKNVVIAAAVIIVLVIVGWFFTRSKPTTVPEVSKSPTPAVSDSASPSASPSAAMTEKAVTISSTGFSPKSITIKSGETITWMNGDSENHTVNSDNHPTHLLYPFLNLGLIKPGEKQSVTISKTGTFTYHDHLNPSFKGSVTVE